MYGEKLKKYKKNKSDIQKRERIIQKLREKKENLRVVSGKVMKSSEEFPYIRQSITVEMIEPKHGSRIEDRIRKNEEEKRKLIKEVEEAEKHIQAMPEGIEKQICEMFFLDGNTQEEIAETIGYTQGRVSQILNKIYKD